MVRADKGNIERYVSLLDESKGWDLSTQKPQWQQQLCLVKLKKLDVGGVGPIFHII